MIRDCSTRAVGRARQIVPAICLLLCTASTTQAAPIFWSSATAYVTYLGVPSDQDYYSVLMNDVDSVGPLTATLPGGSAYAEVTNAVLHASAASVMVTTAYAYAQFFDTLLLTSSNLAPGTEVYLSAEMAFSRTVVPNNISGPCVGGAVAYAGLNAVNSQGTAGTLFEQDTTCNQGDINNGPALIRGFIGQELTVSAYLNAATSAIGFASSSADAAHTFQFFLTPVGDFTYSSASGNSYLREASPVPEPSIFLLLGTAAATLASRVRHRVTKSHRD